MAPQQVRTELKQIQNSCQELNQESVPDDLDQGVGTVDLGGSRAIIVNAGHVCNSRMAGANCANRGCDLMIWKQSGKTGWKKVFDGHLHRSFISIDDTIALE
jgi:hypothetical protein